MNNKGVNNKGADLNVWMHKLVCAFFVYRPPKTGFLALRPIYHIRYLYQFWRYLYTWGSCGKGFSEGISFPFMLLHIMLLYCCILYVSIFIGACFVCFLLGCSGLGLSSLDGCSSLDFGMDDFNSIYYADYKC